MMVPRGLACLAPHKQHDSNDSGGQVAQTSVQRRLWRGKARPAGEVPLSRRASLLSTGPCDDLQGGNAETSCAGIRLNGYNRKIPTNRLGPVARRTRHQAADAVDRSAPRRPGFWYHIAKPA